MDSFKYVMNINGHKVVVADCVSLEACNAARRLMNTGICSECRQAKVVRSGHHSKLHIFLYSCCQECFDQ